MADRMKSYFPADADCRALDGYMEAVTDASRQARVFAEGDAQHGRKRRGRHDEAGLHEYAERTTLEVLTALTDNRKLIGVLTGQFGDYGLPPAQSSFAMHAMLVRHYFNGGAYPVGGAGRIFESIAPIIQASGGVIATNAEVTSVVCEKGRAVGVQMADGRILKAPVIISGAGVATTASQLLEGEALTKSGLTASVRRVDRLLTWVCTRAERGVS